MALTGDCCLLGSNAGSHWICSNNFSCSGDTVGYKVGYIVGYTVGYIVGYTVGCSKMCAHLADCKASQPSRQKSPSTFGHNSVHYIFDYIGVSS
jgi:hypothetical protein